MAKKRKKRRPAARPTEETRQTAVKTEAPAPSREAPAPAAASVSTRRAHKEEARRAREAAYKRIRRRALLRRGLVWGGLAAAIAGAVVFFLNQAEETSALQEEARAIAETANCSGVTHPPSLGASHNPPYDYAGQVPAASGPHDPSPMPANVHVYDEPIPQQRGVHNLEHGYMLVYYRADGDGALPQDVVEALESFAEDSGKTIMAPYPSLPAGIDLAFVGWTTLQQCPSQNRDGQALSSDDAVTMARAFRVVAGDVAPEPAAP